MSKLSAYLSQINTQPVFVENLGGLDIFVKVMTVAESTEYLRKATEIAKDDKLGRAKELALMIVDEKNQPIFNIDNKEDLEDLSKLPFSFWQKCNAAFSKASGVAVDEKK